MDCKNTLKFAHLSNSQDQELEHVCSENVRAAVRGAGKVDEWILK